MKYSKEERLEIGRQIYDGTITDLEATMKFDIGFSTARKYLIYYCEQNQLTPKTPKRKAPVKTPKKECAFSLDLEIYKRLSERADKSGISKSIIASKAIGDFLDNVSKSESDSDLVISFLKRK